MTTAADTARVRAALMSSCGSIAAIAPAHAARFVGVIGDLSVGREVPDALLLSVLGQARASRAAPYANGVAVINMVGVALYDVQYEPYCFSTRLLAQKVNAAAADPAISTVVLLCSSPGGVCTGVMEAADAVFAARKQKKVIAVVDPLCASAAFWICSQASTIVAVPSAEIGSVGVFVLHLDLSGALGQEGIKPTFIYAGEHKTEGNSFEPLNQESARHLQSQVDSTYADFIGAISRGRNVSRSTVKELFGGGRTLIAADALKIGMIDNIASNPDAAMRAALSAPSTARAVLNRLARDPVPTTGERSRRRRRLELLRH